VNASSIITLLLLVAIFYLFLIAPQRRRARAQQDMLGKLRPGAQVVTTAGMFATVVQVGDDDVHLEIAPGVVSRYARAAISRVLSDGEAPDADDDALDAHDGPDAGGGGAEETGGPTAASQEHEEHDGPSADAPPKDS
jgi:preprotein translocase subunit YajC